jgi:type I restriction enzyme S subunit
LFWSLKGHHFRSHVGRVTQGSKVQHLYNSNLETALIAFPTCKSEQVSIYKSLDSVEDSISQKSEKLEHFTKLKKALMQDLLTGKVRVNTEQSNSALTVG